MDEITDSLQRALDRVDGFRAIHAGRDPGDLGPVRCLYEAVGIGDQALALFHERWEGPTGELTPHETDVLLGLIIGLLAAQFEAERGPRQPAVS